jgi:hypothetical protein
MCPSACILRLSLRTAFIKFCTVEIKLILFSLFNFGSRRYKTHEVDIKMHKFLKKKIIV